MNCTDIWQLAPLYLSGELDSARTEQFAAHLRTCDACAREIGQQQAFDSLLQAGVLSEPIDSATVERVERAVERMVRRSIAAESRRRVLAVAGIAATLAVAAFGIRMASRAARATIAPIYTAAAFDHRIEIVDGQPRKWFTDPAAIEGLARSQGIAESAVYALAPAGYRLAKAKVCLLDGRLFLHLVYANAAGNVSLYLRRTDRVRSVHAETRGKEHVAGFQEHQLTAVVVTEQPGDAAERLARTAFAIL